MKRVALEQVAEVIRGTPLDRKARTDEGIPVYGLDNLSERNADLPPCIPESDIPRSAHRLREDDVVIALIGQVGRAKRMGQAHAGAVLDRECAALRLQPGDNPITPGWLMVWLNSSDFRSQIEPRQRGATMQRVRADELRTLQVPLAPLERQTEATSELANFEAALGGAEQQILILKRLRDTTIDLRVYAGMDDR
jgi:restriction endonuclease S subunit